VLNALSVLLVLPRATTAGRGDDKDHENHEEHPAHGNECSAIPHSLARLIAQDDAGGQGLSDLPGRCHAPRPEAVDGSGDGPTVAPVLSLLTDLRDFVARHRPHGQLIADATEPQADGYMLTVRCPCGVELMRWATPGEATRELVQSQLLASGS
jgi:hypothetical protein